jgi:hypothetical protein
MINLNRPTEDDAAALRQSRIVAFDANARAEKRKAPKHESDKPDFKRGQWPAYFGGGVYAFITETECRQIKPAAAIEKLTSSAIIQQAYATLADNLNAASGAALVGTKPQPDADGWIPFECTKDSVCPVPNDVDFEAKDRAGRTFKNDRNAALWGHGSGHPCDAVAYRILPAKPAAIPGWRRGPDVPESERKGLWFVRTPGSARPRVPVALPADELFFDPNCEYRPAPPGVKEGDAYEPALYGEEA